MARCRPSVDAARDAFETRGWCSGGCRAPSRARPPALATEAMRLPKHAIAAQSSAPQITAQRDDEMSSSARRRVRRTRESGSWWRWAAIVVGRTLTSVAGPEVCDRVRNKPVNRNPSAREAPLTMPLRPAPLVIPMCLVPAPVFDPSEETNQMRSAATAVSIALSTLLTAGCGGPGDAEPATNHS